MVQMLTPLAWSQQGRQTNVSSQTMSDQKAGPPNILEMYHHTTITSLHLHSYHFLVLNMTNSYSLFIKLIFYHNFLGKLHYKKPKLQLLVGIKKYV